MTRCHVFKASASLAATQHDTLPVATLAVQSCHAHACHVHCMQNGAVLSLALHAHAPRAICISVPDSTSSAVPVGFSPGSTHRRSVRVGNASSNARTRSRSGRRGNSYAATRQVLYVADVRTCALYYYRYCYIEFYNSLEYSSTTRWYRCNIRFFLFFVKRYLSTRGTVPVPSEIIDMVIWYIYVLALLCSLYLSIHVRNRYRYTIAIINVDDTCNRLSTSPLTFHPKASK